MPSLDVRRHQSDTDDVIEVDIFELPADHPGFADHAYRSRRAAIAEVAARFRPGEAIPLDRGGVKAAGHSSSTVTLCRP